MVPPETNYPSTNPGQFLKGAFREGEAPAEPILPAAFGIREGEAPAEPIFPATNDSAGASSFPSGTDSQSAMAQPALPKSAALSLPNNPETMQTAARPAVPVSRQAEPGKPRPPVLPTKADDDSDEPLSLLDRLRSIDLGTALAFLCFSVALLLNSIDDLELGVKPLAALGLMAGLLGGTLPALWRRKAPVGSLIMSVLCLLVLLLAGSWPGASSRPPPHVTVPLKQKGMAVHPAAGAEDWVDASANAVQHDDVRVQIVSARAGPVDLKRKASAVASAERFLAIRLRVSYEGVVSRQTPYEPWADLPDSPSPHPPTLADDQDRTYVQKVFDPGWKVAGRADVDALNPGHQVKEVLVYPVPPGDVQYLRLTLPASAFGLSGEFRFQIPRDMIRGL